MFVFILLTFQALRLTEFILIHGVTLDVIGMIVLFLTVSFLPVILPMSLLFAALLTYARLSQDSEILAMRALGLQNIHLLFPSLALSLLATLLSAQISFYLAPWGNRQFEVLVHELGQSKAAATIREGVFSEGFFDMVIYANKINSQTNQLKQVFIYDERTPSVPLTIISKEAEIIRGQTKKDATVLRLIDGDIHRTHEDTYTKVHFQTHEINLFDESNISERAKSLPSYNIDELKVSIQDPNTPKDRKLALEVEYHRRWAMSFACLIFGLLGFGLGTTTNKRAARSAGFVLCLGVIVAYWVLYIVGEAVAKKGLIPPAIAVWAVDILFMLAGLLAIKRTTN